jgi:hypothetical protein
MTVTPTLRTGRYTTHRAEHGVAVAASIGQPKWPLPYPLEHELRDLMPFGLFGRDLPPDEFEARYRKRLERVGVDRLRRQFQAIAAEHRGEPLVLLCREKPGEPCHRRVFADWWRERTGEAIPEVEPEPAHNEHTMSSGQLALGVDGQEDR